MIEFGPEGSPDVRWVSMTPSNCDIEWLWDRLVPKVGAGFLHGATGAGKTFLSVDKAIRLLQGKDWFGRKPNGARGTHFILGEGAASFPARVKASMQHHGLCTDTGHLVPITSSGARLSQSGRRIFEDGASIDEFIEHVRHTWGRSPIPLGEIVVDTFSRACWDPDDNVSDPGAGMRAVDGMERIAHAMGVAVTAIHHPTKIKKSKEMWGPGTLKAFSDFVLFADGTNIIAQKVRDAAGDDLQLGRYTLKTVGLSGGAGGPVEMKVVQQGAQLGDNAMRASRRPAPADAAHMSPRRDSEALQIFKAALAPLKLEHEGQVPERELQKAFFLEFKSRKPGLSTGAPRQAYMRAKD